MRAKSEEKKSKTSGIVRLVAKLSAAADAQVAHDDTFHHGKQPDLKVDCVLANGSSSSERPALKASGA